MTAAVESLRVFSVWASFDLGLRGGPSALKLADVAAAMWNVEYEPGESQLVLRYPPLKAHGAPADSGNNSSVARPLPTTSSTSLAGNVILVRDVVASLSSSGTVKAFINKVDTSDVVEAVCRFIFEHILQHVPHARFENFRIFSWKGSGSLMLPSSSSDGASTVGLPSKRTRKGVPMPSGALTLEKVSKAATAACSTSVVTQSRSHNMVTIRSSDLMPEGGGGGDVDAEGLPNAGGGGGASGGWVHMELSLANGRFTVHHASCRDAAEAFLRLLAFYLQK